MANPIDRFDIARTHLSSSKRDLLAEYAVAASCVLPSLTSRRNGKESSLKQQGETDGTECVIGSDLSRFEALFRASFFRRRASTKRLLIISADSSKLSIRV